MHPLFALLVLSTIVAAQILVVAAMGQLTTRRKAPAVVLEDDRGWVEEVGVRAALALVERELRTIASRTPLPIHAGDEGSWEMRYRTCNRQMRAIARVLVEGDAHERAIAHLIKAAPASGTQMSTNVKAYAAHRLVRDALDHLWDQAAA
jgi:hypothetical protein